MISPFSVLAEDEDLPRWDRLPDQLAELYGSAIGLDEPCVVANFVESLDGVVAVPGLPRSHAVIGDESEADSFVLALMRACSDAVVVGSGTLLASPKGTWRVDRAYPPAAPLRWPSCPSPPWPAGTARNRRRRLDRRVARPRASGARSRCAGADDLSASRLRYLGAGAAEVVAVNAGDTVDLARALDVLRDRGCSTAVLSEAGPTMFG